MTLPRPWSLDRASVGRLAIAWFALALAVRSIGIGGRWLWFDELLSASFAAHGPWVALLSALRFDQHPPLYYMQLSVWALAGRSDVWLMLNSAAWSAAAVALLFVAARRVFDASAARWAAWLLLASPAALAFSDQVRMYSMLSAAIIWAWLAQVEWCLAPSPGWRRSAAVIASQLLVIYSHSAGLVMISGNVILGAGLMAARRDGPRLARWLRVEALAGLGALPAVAIAVFRDVSHTFPANPWNALMTLRFLVAGEGGSLAVEFALAGAAFAAIVWVCQRRDEQSWLVGAPLFVPLIIAGIASYAFKPIWLYRTFVTVIPFLCLAVAVALQRWWEPRDGTTRWRRAVVLVFVAAWSATGFASQVTRPKGDGFKAAASALAQSAGPDAIVLVDGDFVYWSLMWYLGGPDWGRPQQAHVTTPQWSRLLSRLPAGLTERLGFGDRDRALNVDGVRVGLWDRSHPRPIPAATAWIVRLGSVPPLEVPGRVRRSSRRYDNLLVEEWAAPPARE
jgi:hypothetical protein